MHGPGELRGTRRESRPRSRAQPGGSGRRQVTPAASEEKTLEGRKELLAAKRLDLRGAAVVLGDDRVVLECPVRGFQTIIELVALPHLVVRARRLALTMLGIHLAADGPDRAGPALDPDHDAFGAPAVVAPVHDPFGEAPGCRGSLHALDYTIALASGNRRCSQGCVLVSVVPYADRRTDGSIRDPGAPPRPPARRDPPGQLRDEPVLAGADPPAPRPARRRARARRGRRRRGEDTGRRVATSRARGRAPQPRCPRRRARST